jgi:putative methionine-R-sulfoxide reductase with GAF domain
MRSHLPQNLSLRYLDCELLAGQAPLSQGTEMNIAVSTLRDLAYSQGSREQKARVAAEVIRIARPYRWVGLYDVTEDEIAVIAWNGPEPPTYPRFSVFKGLNGAAVASRRPVVVQDVTIDSRYLTAIVGTRGEMIHPILRHTAEVVGTIDVESDSVNAFSAMDELLLAACADALRWLWIPSGVPDGL